MSVIVKKTPSGFPRWDVIVNGVVISCHQHKYEAEEAKQAAEAIVSKL